jgi:hypothetical protein
VASPRVHLRLDERLHGRALQAAESEGSTLSEFVRAAILAKLGAVRQEVAGHCSSVDQRPWRPPLGA